MTDAPSEPIAKPPTLNGCHKMTPVQGVKKIYNTRSVLLPDSPLQYEGPMGNIGTHDVNENGIPLKEPGRWCVKTTAANSSCLSSASIFAVSDPTRKGTEYAVPLYKPLSNRAHVNSDFNDATVRAVAPSFLPYSTPYPVFFIVETHDTIVDGTWVKEDFSLQIQRRFLETKVAGEYQGRSTTIMLRRGVGSVWVVPGNHTSPPPYSDTDRPVLSMGIEGVLSASLDRFKTPTASVTLTKPPFHPTDRTVIWDGPYHGTLNSVVMVTNDITIPSGDIVTIPQGTTLLLSKSVVIVVKGTLIIEGTEEAPVLIMPNRLTEPYSGFQVHGEMQGSWIIATGSGFVKPRLKNTGKHRKEHPFISSVGELFLQNTHLMELHGPGFGLGKQGSSVFEKVFVSGVQQGGECVFCTLSLKEVYIGSIPNETPYFVDGDNDGFYFRGGEVGVKGLVVVDAKDDCIDSASSKESPGGLLRIEDSILDGCHHEGIALSGSHIPSPRVVTIVNTNISHAQQAVEVGYTPSTHTATVAHCHFTKNIVAIRYGDNYNLAVLGTLRVTDTTMLHNMFDVVNLVKHSSTPSPRSLNISRSVLRDENTFCGRAQWVGSDNVFT